MAILKGINMLSVKGFDTTIISVFILLFASSPSYGVELSDLREIIREQHAAPHNGRLIFNQEVMCYLPAEELAREMIALTGDQNFLKLAKIDQYQHNSVEALVWPGAEIEKIQVTDRRDVEGLLRQAQIDSIYVMTLSKDLQSVSQNNNIIALKETPEASLLCLHQVPRQASHYFRMLEYGLLDKSLLSDNHSPELEEVVSNGKTLLEIRLTTAGGRASRVIQCDPALGYRIKSDRYYAGGVLLFETVFADYEIIDGMAFPLSYSKKNYDNGDLVSHTHLAFEAVEFNLDLSEDDFKLTIPAGTYFDDLAFNTGLGKLIETELIAGIYDIITFTLDDTMTQELENLPIIGYQNSSEIYVLIPSVSSATEQNRNYIYIFEDAGFLQVTSQRRRQLFSDPDNVLGLEKGDIAWDGRNLLLLRKAALFEAEDRSGRTVLGQKWTETFEPSGNSRDPLALILRTEEARYYSLKLKDVSASRAILSFTPIDETLIEAKNMAHN